MKLINFLLFMTTLIISTSSQGSTHKDIGNEDAATILYKTPRVTYKDIEGVPNNLTREHKLILNDQTWYFSWACENKMPLTSIWDPSEHSFFVSLLDDSGLKGSFCGQLQFATYNIYAQRKSDLKPINTFHYTFYLKTPNSL